MARALDGWAGDAGSTPRSALKAMVRFGLPPSALCPEDEGGFDRPLEPYLFAYGDAMRGARYVRLDPAGSGPGAVRARVRSWLAAGFPCLLGVRTFDSLGDGPEIPSPTRYDRPVGATAVVATGYDDGYRHRSSRGALRVRTSWGRAWGDRGYGWLPYDAIDRGLAADFWTLLRADWLESGEFSRPADVPD